MMTYEKQMTTSNDLFFDNNHGFCKYKTCSKTFNLSTYYCITKVYFPVTFIEFMH